VLSSIRSALALEEPSARRLGITRASRRAIQPGLETVIAFYDRCGIADLRQMRTLVCDGPLLLRYFSIVETRPFATRQKLAFEHCARLIHRRALLDHQLASSTEVRAAFDVVFEALGRAAFVVDQHGVVQHANALGVALLERDIGVRDMIAAAVAGEPSQFDVHPIRERGVRPRFVVIGQRTQLAEVAEALAYELSLSARATQVFVYATTGESTKAIAARLGIAGNTVEYHLTQIYRRLGVATRIELQRVLTERLIGTTRGG
jgi:DNA-binding CsgD family transcriptional regulator